LGRRFPFPHSTCCLLEPEFGATEFLQISSDLKHRDVRKMQDSHNTQEPSILCLHRGVSLKASLCGVSNKQIPDCVGLISTGEPLHTMIGLGKWTNAVSRSTRSLPKARGKVQTSLPSFSDESGMGDNDPAVARTVKTLSVAGSDMPASRQEKEARSVGGIPSR
jgi:hypothetical protein